MTKLQTILDDSHRLDREDLVYLLNLRDKEEMNRLFDRAYEVKLEHVGNKVYFRGIIEFSNICRKDCFYCGIRKSNRKVVRYQMSEEEILECARFALESQYGSVVLQSGERSDAKFSTFIERIVKGIKKLSGGKPWHHIISRRAERGDLPALVRRRGSPLSAQDRNVG